MQKVSFATYLEHRDQDTHNTILEEARIDEFLGGIPSMLKGVGKSIMGDRSGRQDIHAGLSQAGPDIKGAWKAVKGLGKLGADAAVSTMHGLNKGADIMGKGIHAVNSMNDRLGLTGGWQAQVKRLIQDLEGEQDPMAQQLAAKFSAAFKDAKLPVATPILGGDEEVKFKSGKNKGMPKPPPKGTPVAQFAANPDIDYSKAKKPDALAAMKKKSKKLSKKG
jgi:hypothetical protein